MQKQIFKAILAGFIIGLSALVFGIVSTIGGTLEFKILGAFLFSMGLCAICEEQLNLVTGKFGMFYEGLWNLRQILIIFLANLFGIFLAYSIRNLDAQPNLVTDAMAPIVALRDNKIWYQHIFSGILCGACIQIAVYNYKENKSYLGVILPVMVFILIGGEHCIADTFYYLWSSWSINHLINICLVFCGNFIGAILVVGSKTGKLPQLYL